VSRRLLILLAVVAVALATAAVGFSLASFTATSETRIGASASRLSDWVHLYSEESDPASSTIYAHKRTINGGTGTVAATGQDATLAVDLGGFPDKNKTYPYVTVFSVVTPATFPDTAVTQVTVSATLVDDVTDQPLTLPGFTAFGPTGGGPTSVTLGPGQKYQFNVTVKTRKKFTLGHTYWPHVLVDVAWTGVPAGYFQYDVPVNLTDIGGN
jgi:hypothetical protein